MPPLAVIVAAALDLALGDPPNRLHPVAWIGRAIAGGRRALCRGGRAQLVVGGALVTLAVAAVAAAAGLAVATLAARLGSAGPLVEGALLGYRDGSLEWFGKLAARLDDVLNFVPARLAALGLVAGAVAAGEDARGALRMLRRDGALTASPNAGRTMAAMAGALGLTLGKRGAYRLGEGRPPTAGDVARAVREAPAAPDRRRAGEELSRDARGRACGSRGPRLPERVPRAGMDRGHAARDPRRRRGLWARHEPRRPADAPGVRVCQSHRPARHRERARRRRRRLAGAAAALAGRAGHHRVLRERRRHPVRGARALLR